MKNVLQLHGDEVGSTPEENDISQFGKMQNRVCNFVDQSPRRRMQAEQFVHRIGYSGNPIFRHKLSQPAGQMVVFEDLFHEVTIEYRPGFWTFRRVRLEEFEELLSDRVSAGTTLA